jgi:hypothetical protein
MASLLTTAADVGDAMDQTDEVIQGLDAVFTTSCPALSPATLTQWQAFKTSWVNFVTTTESEIYHVPLTGTAFATFNPYAAMTTIEGFQAQVAQWQNIGRTSCNAQGPSIPVQPDPPWLTAIKWGGVTFAVGIGIFMLAPIIEDVVGSAVVARSATSTKRLYRRARQKNPISPSVEVGTLGDVNYLEYGGGPVLRTEHGYVIEWVEPPSDDVDFESRKARWTVYRVNLDQEVPSWGNLESVAESAGIRASDLRSDFLSSDPMKRAWAYQTWANYYGWHEFDNYPLVLTKAEVERRYGENSYTENPRRRRR